MYLRPNYHSNSGEENWLAINQWMITHQVQIGAPDGLIFKVLKVGRLSQIFDKPLDCIPNSKIALDLICHMQE